MPNGWPMAMEPPLTLYFSLSISSRSRQYRHCEAKASLSSQRSTSAIFSPFALSSFGTENTGPMPISSGSQPATVKPRKKAFGSRPSASAFSRLISRVIEAPSESCEALPAVTEPSSANAGFSEARPSRVVSGRLQSSRSTTPSSTCFSPLALSSTA
ncbi:Uncharacterised protein [Klebsiella pneumoniae]|nr:Uncharacterised protein [Klebsiella pneumoniae]